MAYFSNDFIEFFNTLSKNNNREWFTKNKKRYEKFVKSPFEEFIASMIDAMKAIDNRIDLAPRDAIFRINRDIRFSSDKSPYKTHMGAIISAGGKKNKTVPGLYVQFSHADARIYSGAHMLEKDDLYRVRAAIQSRPGEFRKLYEDPKFAKSWGEIRGEKNKILPGEFRKASESEPLMFNKSFYYFQKYPPDFILRDDLIEFIMEQYKIAKPLGDFLSNALGA